MLSKFRILKQKFEPFQPVQPTTNCSKQVYLTDIVNHDFQDLLRAYSKSIPNKQNKNENMKSKFFRSIRCSNYPTFSNWVFSSYDVGLLEKSLPEKTKKKTKKR